MARTAWTSAWIDAKCCWYSGVNGSNAIASRALAAASSQRFSCAAARAESCSWRALKRRSASIFVCILKLLRSRARFSIRDGAR